MEKENNPRNSSGDKWGTIVALTLLYGVVILLSVIVWSTIYGLLAGGGFSGITLGLWLAGAAFFFIWPIFALLVIAGLIAYFTRKKGSRVGLIAAAITGLPVAVGLGLMLQETITA